MCTFYNAVLFFAYEETFYSKKKTSIREWFLVENKTQLHFSGVWERGKSKNVQYYSEKKNFIFKKPGIFINHQFQILINIVYILH